MKELCGVGLALLLVGCDEPLKTVELIDEPRVLGARVEVEGEPERAAPEPGERARARFLLAAPEPLAQLGFALLACPAAVRQGARSECAGEAFASVVSDAGLAEEASLDFEVPAELDPSGRVLVRGVLCPDTSPSVDGAGCQAGGAAKRVTLELDLSRADDVNHNPTLEPEAILFDGEPWSELPPAAGECAGLGYAEVEVGSAHTLEVALDAADRDALPRPSKLDPSRESLQLSHFTTDGDLSRAFESVAWDSDALLRRASWSAPAHTGLVRFWLVLRDFRGGSDFVQRAVCVR
ncbi:MAG TPA: hypothetical protein VIW29_09400 [Polyangiaceae bacterium]